MEKAATARKIDLKQAKANATHLRGVADMLGKELQDLKETANETTSLLQARINIFLGEVGMTHHLQARIKALLEAQKHLTYCRVILWKRCQRLEAAKWRLKKDMHEKAKKHPETFCMMHKGRYTPAARSLTCLLVSTGTAEAKVGNALVEIGNALGVKVRKQIFEALPKAEQDQLT